MYVHLATQDLNFFGELRQRRCITLGKLFDTSSQGSGYAVQFGLHVGGKGSQPLVINPFSFFTSANRPSSPPCSSSISSICRVIFSFSASNASMVCCSAAK